MYRLFYTYFLIFLISGFALYSQNKSNIRPSNSFKRIQIKHADLLIFDKNKSDAQILKGNVWCEHEGTFLYCDSAFLRGSKTMDAYGNIRIVKGDSLMVTGHEMHYDATTRMALLSGSVVCTDRSMRMETPSLYYDTKKNIAGYFNQATIYNGQTILKSKHGHYAASEEMLYFHYDVEITDPEYRLKSDTLKYHVRNKIAYFLGPSIIFNNKDYIYCENGLYDTKKQFSQFGKKSIVHSDNIELRGDSLYYDHKNETGKSLKNIQITDTSEKSNLYGQYAFYEAKGPKFRITGRTLYSRKDQTDSLHLHADTLYYAATDSVHRYISARYHVKIFHPQYQCISDSMHGFSIDSSIHLFGKPILWTERMQCMADTIHVFLSDSGIKKAVLVPKILLVQKTDTIPANEYFNQISGKSACIYFTSNAPQMAEIEGETDMIYFIKEDQTLSGFSKTKTGNAILTFREGELKKSVTIGKTKGTVFPMKELNTFNSRLPVFKWNPELRPQSKNDLFK